MKPLLLLGIALCLCTFIFPVSQAQEWTDQEILALLQEQQPRDVAIDRGLEWIRAQQQPNGAYATGTNRTALSSLAIMSHLAAGITFEDPRYGEQLRQSLRWVISMQGDRKYQGYFGDKDGSRMYGHGICTLMLTEAIGMTDDQLLEQEILAALQPALNLTVNAARIKKDQCHAGGWRYDPLAKDSDLSLSGWQLMSLHSAQQIGLDIPKEIIDAAVAYAEGCVLPNGGVSYQRGSNRDHAALRGLGLFCLALAGKESSEAADRVVDRMRRNPIEWRGDWFFYRVYYDAVGLARARPETWTQYGNELEDLLTRHQSPDGSWPAPPGDNEAGRFGKVYATSMALLALTVNRHVLPAYQR
jgi:hypothetical protein